MDGQKSPLQSLTIVSAGISAMTSLAGLFGVTIDPDLISQGVAAAFQIVSAGGALLAIYGRLRATTKIGAGA